MTEVQQRSRLSFTEAMSIIAARSKMVAPELLPLADTVGTCLAETVHARSDFPRFRASAMDGFAVRAADCESARQSNPLKLMLGVPIHAGDIPTQHEGSQVRPISTGAMLPPDFDAVITREIAAISTHHGKACLRVDTPVRPGLNVRSQGEDVLAGDGVVFAGQAVTPATIGALCCYGVPSILVRRPPSVAILPTGSELATVGAGSLEQAQTYDSNGPMIEAFAQHLGLIVRRAAPIGDNPLSLQSGMDSILKAAHTQILISTGGVSVGDRDLMPKLLLNRGADIHFHDVSMRPGKPVLFATLPNGSLFFGLPGNPVAALLGFRFFVLAAVRAMIGLVPEQGEVVDIEAPARRGTTTFSKAHVGSGAQGRRIITILPSQQSHMMRPLLTANAWLRSDDLNGQQAVRLYPAFPNLIQ